MENKVNNLFQSKLVVTNVGLEVFYDAVIAQKNQCIHVNWKPQAGGNKKLADLLSKLK